MTDDEGNGREPQFAPFRLLGAPAPAKDGGTLEKAAQKANCGSTRMAQLFDCRREELNLDEVVRIKV